MLALHRLALMLQGLGSLPWTWSLSQLPAFSCFKAIYHIHAHVTSCSIASSTSTNLLLPLCTSLIPWLFVHRDSSISCRCLCGSCASGILPSPICLMSLLRRCTRSKSPGALWAVFVAGLYRQQWPQLSTGRIPGEASIMTSHAGCYSHLWPVTSDIETTAVSQILDRMHNPSFAREFRRLFGSLEIEIVGWIFFSALPGCLPASGNWV